MSACESTQITVVNANTKITSCNVSEFQSMLKDATTEAKDKNNLVIGY